MPKKKKNKVKKRSKFINFFIQLILIVIIFLIVGFLFKKIIDTNKSVSPEPVIEESKPVPDITYSLEDIKLHNKKDDCWQAIGGIVYDFTDYLSTGDHPGGNAMAKDCGKDATFRYENDPEHSDYAKSLLPDYAIGKLSESLENNK